MAKKPVQIEFIGGNAEGVTGSATKIKTPDHTYLFEFGMIQDCHTVLENYKVNCKLIQKVKVKEIDYIMLGHCHIDHCGLIPALYEKGCCDAKIIVPKGSVGILAEMWRDCSYINQRDIEILNLKNDRKYVPLYTDDGIAYALENIIEVDTDVIEKINEELSIRYSNAGHILLSKQAEVYITVNGHTKKILFTSDLGNIVTQDSRIFVEDFKPVSSANIVIGECTYSAKGREITKETYKKDIEKIKTVVDQYCVDNKHRVLIPTFSLDRMPYILWILYSLYKDDDNFNVPVIVDSPLANRLLDCYSSILEGELKEKFEDMMHWKNIKRVISPEESKAAIEDRGPKVVCSSSGMLTAGRSVKWTQNVLPNPNDCILFIGYAGEDTLAYKVKHNRENKTININGKPFKNNCQIVDLRSFSSHMQRHDMINYYKGINCEKIYLVHSNSDTKIEFKQDLQDEITKCLKSTKVICVNSSTKISL